MCTKTCNICEEDLPLSDFYARKRDPGTHLSTCKKCMSRTTRWRTYLKKVEAIEYLGGKCLDCGLKLFGDNYSIFDFHHRDPSEKSMEWRKMERSNDWELVKSELDKCDLLCSNCHRMRHTRMLEPISFVMDLMKKKKESQKLRVFEYKKCVYCDEDMLSKYNKKFCSKECHIKHRQEHVGKMAGCNPLVIEHEINTHGKSYVKRKYGVDHKTLKRWLLRNNLSRLTNCYEPPKLVGVDPMKVVRQISFSDKHKVSEDYSTNPKVLNEWLMLKMNIDTTAINSIIKNLRIDNGIKVSGQQIWTSPGSSKLSGYDPQGIVTMIASSSKVKVANKLGISDKGLVKWLVNKHYGSLESLNEAIEDLKPQSV